MAARSWRRWLVAPTAAAGVASESWTVVATPTLRPAALMPSGKLASALPLPSTLRALLYVFSPVMIETIVLAESGKVVLLNSYPWKWSAYPPVEPPTGVSSYALAGS